jgi:hypothetical protein
MIDTAFSIAGTLVLVYAILMGGGLALGLVIWLFSSEPVPKRKVVVPVVPAPDTEERWEVWTWRAIWAVVLVVGVGGLLLQWVSS